MGLDITSYALSKKYTSDTVKGMGAIKGDKGDSGKDGTDGKDGVSVKSMSISTDNVVTATLSDNTVITVGTLQTVAGSKGDKGDAGLTPHIDETTGRWFIGDIDTGYQAVIKDTISFNDLTDVPTIPTSLSQLTNDENFIKNTVSNLLNYYSKSEVYTKDEITSLVSNINKLTTSVVDALPTENISTSTIYLISAGESIYNQYMYIDGEWANLGSTSLDLTGYVTATELANALLNKANSNHTHAELHSHSNQAQLDTITEEVIQKWNQKFSGDYNDLTNKPTIPIVTNDLTDNLKTQITDNTEIVNAHTGNKDIHISSEERMTWNAMLNSAKTYINNKISDISTLKYVIYRGSDSINALQNPQTNTIYFHVNNGNYKMYVYENGWQLVMTNVPELSNYYTKAETYSKTEIDNKAIEISNETGNQIEQKSDGIYVGVQDISSEFERVSNLVDTVSLAQKTVNSDLDYFRASRNLLTDTILANSIIPFNNVDAKNGNIIFNSSTNKITLPANKTYKFTIDIRIADTTNGAIGYCLYDYTHTKQYGNGFRYVSNITSFAGTYSDMSCEGIIKTTEETIVSAYCTESYNSPKIIGYILLQEIGHDITVDPISYVDTTQGIQDSPVGHIISFMGISTPSHYLECDGTTYNIAEYPHLAEHIKTEFGSYNYFGGNETTFAVPNIDSTITNSIYCIKYEPTYYMNLSGIEIEEVLWEGLQTNSGTLIFNNDYDNYSRIIFCSTVSGINNPSNHKSFISIPMSEITEDINCDVCMNFYGERCVLGHFVSTNKKSFVVDTVQGDENDSAYLYKVIGIKTNTQNSSEVV